MHRKLSLPAPSSRDPDLKYLKDLKPGDSVPDVKNNTWSSTLDLIAEVPAPGDKEPDETEAPSIAIYVDSVTDVDSSDPIQPDLDSDVLDELQAQDAVHDSEVKSELCLTDPVQCVLNKGVMSDFNTSDSGFYSSTGQLPSAPQTNPKILLKTKLSLDLTDSEASAISIEQTSLPTFSVNQLPLPPRRNNSEADIPPRPDAPKPVKLAQSSDSKLSRLRAISNQARGLDLSAAKMKLIQVYIDEDDEDKPGNDYMLFDPETDWPAKQLQPSTSGTQSSMGATDDNDFVYSSSTGSSTETSAMTVVERVPHTQVGQRISAKSVDSADTLYSHNTESVASSTVDSFKKVHKSSRTKAESPKVEKDVTNKMSKDETPRVSKTLAAEITEFFRASASKLKPPCLTVHTRRDSKRQARPIQRDISEPALKTTQRLIPRSPYIAPPYEGKRPPPPRPLFYAWNQNSKNAAVRYITASASCSNLGDVDQKTMKNIENATRKALVRANGAKRTIHSNEDRSSKSPRPPLDSKAKPRLKKVEPQEIIPAVKHKPSPVRSFAQNLKDLKIASKNIPKIHITLPTPRITLTKVKTQLPCEYPRDKATVQVKPKSPQDKVKHKMEKRNEHPMSKMRKCASLSKFLDLVKKNNEDLRAKDLVSHKYKRFDTWPQRKRNTEL